MGNMDYYNKFAAVPVEAQKRIDAGRLKGMTDINPMWRIKALTEAFGMCGFGWKYEIVSQRLEEGHAVMLPSATTDEPRYAHTVNAFVDINLYVKVDEKWSEPIPGIGGASYIANERNGLYTSDECFKMALTDALSVACKALGVGADVYWAAGRSKYSAQEEAQNAQNSGNPSAQANTAPTQKNAPATPRELLIATLNERGMDVNQFAVARGLNKNTSPETYIAILTELGVQWNG